MSMDRDALAKLPHLLSPYPGKWAMDQNVLDDAVVLAQDPGISRLERVPGTGKVYLCYFGDDSTSFVNTTVELYAIFCQLFTDAVAESRRIDAEVDADEADQTHAEHGARLLDAFRKVDPQAVSDENSMWAVAAEEIGYGLL